MVLHLVHPFEEAGYYCQHFLLDASKMGVPQRRERVFFICLRKDLAVKFLHFADMFTEIPKIEMEFNEKEIPFKEIDEPNTKDEYLSPSISKHWYLAKEGQGFNEVHENGGMFSYSKVDRDRPLPTITAHHDGGSYHHTIHRPLTKIENCKGGTYPLDYNFLDLKHKYLIGMSVPPVMTAQIAGNIYEQWISKL